MVSLTNTLAFGTLLFGAAFASAQAQVTIAPPAPVYSTNATTLPDVNVQARTAPSRTPQHYTIPAGYDSDPAMHPYTSGYGPCTEGASPSQGCRHPTGTPIPPSHYEQPPFNR